ncbi:hypothetical protein [Nonomuraea sp. NPDC052265]|uniref:hypothetical protein n=1 Tax=Nonomuraea sp. NPDC052265 TaxID=3364374 RepID=UPI0037C8A96C
MPVTSTDRAAGGGTGAVGAASEEQCRQGGGDHESGQVTELAGEEAGPQRLKRWSLSKSTMTPVMVTG